MLKVIRCAVPADALDDFAAGQTRWRGLATIDGFVAQLGGWARHAERTAVVVAMWRDRASYDSFMLLHHDRMAMGAGQRGTYAHLTVELAEATLAIDLAGPAVGALVIERDAAGAVLAVAADEGSATGTGEVVDVASTWTVVAAPRRPDHQHRSRSAIELRVATPDDADAVADYHARCFRKTFAAQLLAAELAAPDREGTRQQLRDWFQPESGFETRVAIVDGAPIGHMTVRGHQLVHLFVEPDHQGIGLGRHLLEHGEAMLAADGHVDVELHARVENLAAIAFYERAGWTVTDQVVHTIEHGISYDEHVLVKQLRQP